MRIAVSEPSRLPRAIDNRQSKIENHRRGFTLVELLLVISILVVLVALTASIVSKAYHAIKRSTSERTLQRVHERIARRYQQLVKEAREGEPSPSVFLLAGGSSDRERRRAKVIQLKLLQKWNFPMNYKELWNHIAIGWDATNNREVITGHPTAVALYKAMRQRIAPSRVDLSGIPGTAPNCNPTFGLAAAYDVYTENAACLALIYEHLGSVGELTEAELQDTDGDGLKELCDAWGNPLRFYRWPTDHVDDDPAQPVVSQLYQSAAGLINSTKLELAYEKNNTDIDDEQNLLYEFVVPPGVQRWYTQPVTTPFGNTYFAVDIFEGRAASNIFREHLWLKHLSFHRITRQRQDQNMSPQQRVPRAVYAPLVIASTGIDKEFGLFWADHVDPNPVGQYAITWPPGPPQQFFDFWLKPDRMMIYNAIIPEADPSIASGQPMGDQRQREFDNLYTFRSRLTVEGQ